MQFSVILQHAGNAEIAKNDLCMLLITEKQITRLHILMQDIVTVTISQGCSCLQRYTAELIQVTIQVVVNHRPTPEIFHQFIVPALTIDIHFSVVDKRYDHLKLEIIDGLQHLLVDIERRIIDL